MRKTFLSYYFVRFFVWIWVNQFFKKIIIENREKMPRHKPIVAVMNHQNSFMDAFVIVIKYRHFWHFMTRAQVFNIPIVGPVLRSLNLIPIYRVRDGMRSVKKNEEIFKETARYLKLNDGIIIFPEANHDLKRRLRPLSKGFSRMIFGTMDEYDWEPDLQVMPICLNYSDHRNSKQTIRVVLKDPIPIKEYEELYKEDPNVATRKLKEQVTATLREDLVHVPNVEDYNAYHILLDEMEDNHRDITDPHLMNKRIETLSEMITEEDVEIADEITKSLDTAEIRLKYILQGIKWYEWILMIPGFFVWLNSLLPYLPIRHLTLNVIKDHAFDISIKVLAVGVLFPFYYLLISLLIGLISGSWLYAGIYLAISVSTMTFFPYALRFFTKLSHKRKFKIVATSALEENIEHFKGIREKLVSGAV